MQQFRKGKEFQIYFADLIIYFGHHFNILIHDNFKTADEDMKQVMT